MHERYRRAERLLPHNADRLIFDAGIRPTWCDGSEAFWYARRSRQGRRWVLVDPEAATKEPLFDHVRLAAAISEKTSLACTEDTLPLAGVTPDLAGNTLAFEAGGRRYRCEQAGYTLTDLGPVERRNREESQSPDGKWSAFVSDGDLFVRPTTGGDARRLTFDAEEGVAYATPSDTGALPLTLRKLRWPQAPVVAWSPDSTKILTHRLDQRDVPWLALVDSGPADEPHRPALHRLRYPMPGDPLPVADLVVVDVATGRVETVPDSTHLSPFTALLQWRRAWWSEDGSCVWFVVHERGKKAQRLKVADLAAGTTRTVIEEEAETTVDVSPLIARPPAAKVLRTGDIAWFSERDGWGHLYLHDGTTGAVRHRLTSGSWVVRDLVRVDEDGGWAYFHGAGREAGRNPYLVHLYRVPLDGGDVELLSPEHGHHEPTFSPSGRFFFDAWSRPDVPPVAVVRSAAGELVVELEQADISPLAEGGWTMPEPFTVKAADGVTDLYGVLWKPADFDPSRRYPVLDSIYPGPQIIRQFACGFGLDAYGNAAAVAQLGFVVVVLDGRGTPLRSRQFRDLSYGSIGCAGFLEDHVAGITELADRLGYLDLERVGIYGHSGGGYAAARAVLAYPDFFKVAVASAGNHDQASYNSVWGETYHGLLDGDNYRGQANKELAANLRGKLLLLHGELDDNVHPAMTLQLARALMQAGKDFELLIVPGEGHEYFELKPYVLKRQWDFFVRHLLGEAPPEGYRISPEAGAPPAPPSDS